MQVRRLAAAISLGLAVSIATAAGAARVDSFSPRGVAKQVRQVAARFSEPIVPLGDPRAARDPFAIECSAKGRGRWADARTWIYAFDETLPAGVRCAFTVRSELRTLSGAAVVPGRFEFSTGGPSVVEIEPSYGKVAEDQRFAVKLDAPAVRDTVESHAFVRAGGLPDPIGLRVVEGPERDAALASLDWDPKDARQLVLEARQRFAPEAKLVFTWDAGIATASGVATDRAQTFDFEVRPAFDARIYCNRENEKADCVPLGRLQLGFSSPVAWEQASKIRLRTAEGAAQSWSAERVWPGEGDPLVEGVAFRGPFPRKTKLVVELPPDLRDDAGRALPPGPIETRTDRFPPLAKFSARFGVVESAAPALPVALRHVADAKLRGEVVARTATVDTATPAALIAWLHRLASASDDAASIWPETSHPKELALPQAAEGEDAEVVGIPLDGPGLHVVEIESRLLGEALLDPPSPMYVAAGALVTNLAVHFKWGRESSLVWVTALDTGDVVAGASVAVADCHGATLADAVTDASGVARFASLPSGEAVPKCDFEGYSDYSSGLLVTARRGGDLGIAHSSWGEGLEAWRFGLPTEWTPKTALAHTVLDRMLFRAGETVHMKHVIRQPMQAGFGAVPPADRPAKAVIRHVGSDDSWELPLTWQANGSSLSEWTIPAFAKLGTYEIELRNAAGDAAGGGASGSFRVETFRVPLMKGVVQPPAEPLVRPRELPLDVAVSYLAGGAASSQTATLRTQVRERETVEFPDFDGYAFANGGVKEGVERRSFNEVVDAWEHDWQWGEDGSLGVMWRKDDSGDRRGPVATQDVVLDAAGTARATVSGLPTADRPLEVVAELGFRDPSGETQTVATTVPLWPSSRLVGLQHGDFGGRDRVALAGAVLDTDGKPIRLASAEVDVYERKSYSARKRMVGGFYAYESVEEVTRIGRFCSVRTDAAGRFACEGAPPRAGNLVFVARTSDWRWHESVAHVDVFVPGDDATWFAQGDGDRMELVPEKRRYEPGETARIQVRMPFRAATALVTVEREGVGESFVAHPTAADPVVSVPITGADAPNVFVSVLAVRGREAEPAPTGTVDLAKPAVRLGIAELRVGWRDRTLAVRVEPEQATYRVREKARVHVHVRTPDGGAPGAGGEVAIAAVDEGLLQLAPNPSWKLLDAMMGRRAYAVANATAALEVVGKRHYGRKAVPTGGGGGASSTRELFDTLLSWQARVPLDAAGDATVEIPLNDSLTSFRIAAVATVGADRFGAGEGSIRTTQELMVLEGLPKLVREGDRFRAGFTLRNTTDTRQVVTLRANVEGLAQPLDPIVQTLAAGESSEIGWDVDVPTGVGTLGWDVEVSAKSGLADRLRVAQRIEPAVPVRVLQATLLQVTGTASVPVERPHDAAPERGGLDVALRPRLADSRAGIERAMREYPYSCIEQRASVAVALHDDARWRAVMDALPAHLDADGFAAFFPPARRGSVVLTAYLLSLADEARRTVPDGPRDRMLGALERFVKGEVERDEALQSADLPLRKLAATEALARHGRATPELVSAIAFEPRLLPNGALLDWISILDRTPSLPRRGERLAEADALLRARLDVQGSALGFSSSRGGWLDWMLATSDVNAARLVLARLHAPAWRDDEPRLVRSLVALQRRGSWPTTMANAWGTLALDRFSEAFETVPVTGETSASLGVAQGRIEWAHDAAGGSFALPWPDARTDLSLRHEGTGAPWALVQATAAVPLRAPFASGYRIDKRVEPVSQRTPGRWTRGDVARVHVEVDAEAESPWVVVSDPLPTGATVLGRGLGGDTGLLAQGERDAGAAWPAFTEARDDAWRRYYEWAPQGKLVAEYTIRLNQSGRFLLPPTRVEALYAPERMGERPNDPIEVAP
jgi:uncharacterized protein YfaS (alpha-2-macroglobulin family)